jgi:hypothetical protein
LLLALAATLVACSGSGSSARSKAEAFLDAHYVHMDLDSAKQHASGLALDKIDKEIQLTKNQEITGETRQPRVNYRLQRGDETPAAGQFIYELTIRVPGADPFKKLVMVTVRNEQGAWAVTNYNDSDLPEPASGG